MGLEVGGLELVTVGQVRFRVDLPGPVDPGVLASGSTIPSSESPGGEAGGPDLQAAGPRGLMEEDLERHDVPEVEGPRSPKRYTPCARVRGQPAHAVGHGVGAVRATARVAASPA